LKTLKLHLEENYAQLAFGLVSAEKDYRICWHVNQALKISFERVNDHTVEGKKGEKNPFQLYKYSHEDDMLTYFLIRNKNNGITLVPEYKLADCILVIEGEIWQLSPENLKKQLSKVSTIQAVMPIDVNTLKSKQNLIIDA